MHTPGMRDELIARLLKHRGILFGYIRKRISSPELAEDILQECLLKALRAAPELRNEERLLPWFFRILNNAIIDAYRRRGIETSRRDAGELRLDEIAEPGPDDESMLCSCFRELIPTLKPEYASLIERLELGSERTENVAAELGISPNNLKVRRHRARQALRRRLEETCRVCAEHGCMDCTCTSG